MQTLSQDTPADIERIQIQMLQASSPERRFEILWNFIRQVAIWQRAALKRRHPQHSEREIDRMVLSLNYGDDLARRVCAYLERRPSV